MDLSNTTRGSDVGSPAKNGPPFVSATHIPTVIVRPAENGDVDAMNELVRAAYSPYIPVLGYPPPPMRKDYNELLGKHPVWVAANADALVGLLELIFEVDHVIVENLAVAPSYHDRKLGRWFILRTAFGLFPFG
jgi:N-acetylglutamate synthase-like GNAT family acetyltransferase